MPRRRKYEIEIEHNGHGDMTFTFEFDHPALVMGFMAEHDTPLSDAGVVDVRVDEQSLIAMDAIEGPIPAVVVFGYDGFNIKVLGKKLHLVMRGIAGRYRVCPTGILHNFGKQPVQATLQLPTDMTWAQKLEWMTRNGAPTCIPVFNERIEDVWEDVNATP